MTSIEWLQEQILEHIEWKAPTEKRVIMKKIEQAKEMHKVETEATENTSDGYHTFKELYEFRKAYNVALFNEWGKFDIPYYDVHKSWKHNDGELCFGGGWFIVVAVLPTGQISNHYEAKDWDLFKIPEVEKAKYPFDGHTGQDVINRLLSIQETFVSKGSDTLKDYHIVDTNEMVDQVPDVRKMVEDDVEKLAEKQFPYPKDIKDKNDVIIKTKGIKPFNHAKIEKYRRIWSQGYNKAKETLYTEEQVREALYLSRLHNICECEIGTHIEWEHNNEDIIQSLKQPKK